MCLPFLYLPKQKGFAVGTEPMIEALAVLVRCVAHVARSGKARPTMLTRTPHTAEWEGDKEGLRWFSKACESARIATTIVNPECEKGKHKRWHAYLGGGAVGHDHSYLLQGVVVLAKDWVWAAFTIVALWLIS